MINIRKGQGHSLLQTDLVLPVTTGVTVVAGMVVSPNTSTGSIQLGGSASSLFGFAVNSSTDSDVLAAGSIGMITLDGDTVVETDQVYDAITSGNFPLGAPVYPQTGNTGLVTMTNTVAKVLGYVYSIRQLPGTSIVVNGVKVQGPTTVLGIKLAV
jgi:hypothetical protein